MRYPACGYENNNKKQRSSPENRYFHGVVLPILSQSESFGGWTKEEIKNFLKDKFLRSETMIKTKTGLKEVARIKGSSELTTVEWEKWMSEIRRWASLEIGIFLPNPNENVADCQ